MIISRRPFYHYVRAEGECGFISEDLWLYSAGYNRGALDALTQYVYEQGLTPYKPDVDSMSPPSTLDDEMKV